MDVDENKIISLCKKNSPKGFDYLYDKFQKYIYSICYRYTNDKDDSLDLVQEIYIKVYKNFHSFNEKMLLKPWIRQITVNTCLNHIRDNKKKKENEKLCTEEFDIETISSTVDNVEDRVIYFDTKKLIEDEVSKMPENIKMVFILRHFKKLSYAEIAKILSLPLGTIKTNIYKGRRMLKDIMEKNKVWEV